MSRASRADAAFTAYLDLGPLRSLARLREALATDPSKRGFERAPSLRTLESWSSRHSWAERIEHLEWQAREEEQHEYVEHIKEYRARLRQEGLLLQTKGLEWLGEKDAGEVRAGDAIRAIAEGFKLEALALGEATDRVTISEGYGDVLDRLSDDELRRLVEILRAPPAAGALGAGESES